MQTIRHRGTHSFDRITAKFIDGLPMTIVGNQYFVDGNNGSDSNAGTTSGKALATVAAAIAKAVANDVIFVFPGEYDEAVTIAHTKSNLTIVGLGGRGAAYIAPSATNATALTNHSDDLTLVNIGLDGDGSGSALSNTGSRVRAYGCKIEGAAVGLLLTLGTVVQIAAETRGKGADNWFFDCEICWNTIGIKLVCTDYGAITQNRFRDCTFHDNSAADFEEAVGSGGSAAVGFRDLDVGECHFLRQEDGTTPTKYISLNDANENSGVVHCCSFPSAINSGFNLVSTALIWVSNFHTGGISTGQPS
jgi:hypothetical protein